MRFSHLPEVEVGHARAAGLDHFPPIVAGDGRQRLAPRDARIEKLLARGCGEKEMVAADLVSSHRLTVESLEVAVGEGRRGGQSLYSRRGTGELTIDGGGERLQLL